MVTWKVLYLSWIGADVDAKDVDKVMSTLGMCLW